METLFNVGYNWDQELIPFFRDLNDQHKGESRIAFVYGSIQTPFGRSARPISRVPSISEKDFIETCRLLHLSGIKINYTLNASCLGDLSVVTQDKTYFLDELKRLEPHIDMITVAHPLVLELLVDNYIDVDIEISTILNVDTVAHFFWYSTIPRIKKICLAISRNRDISFLETLAEVIAEENLPKCELIVNEFCSVSGVNCEGIYRQSCYQCHSHNVSNLQSTEAYPMSRCVRSRNAHPASWLMAKFILPQWIDKYMKIGIQNYKITGRTHPTEFIKQITQTYMEKNWNGNLLELWAQLQTIWEGYSYQNEAIDIFPFDKIFCDDPLIENVIDRFFKYPDFRCSESCIVQCNTCQATYKKILKKGKAW